jgi:hypothetical protein
METILVVVGASTKTPFTLFYSFTTLTIIFIDAYGDTFLSNKYPFPTRPSRDS